MKDRIFHWAKLCELSDWMACGWVFAPTNAPMHHHDYSFLLEWLCDCPMPRPGRWQDHYVMSGGGLEK